MTRVLLRACGALALAALLFGPSAEAHAPGAAARSSAAHHARAAHGDTTNEWLMMGRSCGASVTG